ncbi:GDP-mannose 4,6-dehydratase [Bacteriovoracales bacterium]|nr:GDP-mannose 4,6-dehydratase [Bacteriovoracales bacterium]
MRVLVTGAAGFVGSHLSELALERGLNVVGIDNFDPFYDPSLKKENIELALENDRYTFFEGDLRDKKFLESIYNKFQIDCTVHLAAKAGVRPSLQNPFEYISSNIEGTVSIMEVIKTQASKKLVFASSSSVYGQSIKIPFCESDPLSEAISIYAATKLSGENFTKMYHNLYSLDVINLRLFTVYGPRQRPDLAISKFLSSCMKGEKITLFGDGSMQRDYTYVKDIVDGIFSAVERLDLKKGCYEIFNLGNSCPVSLSHLISAVEKTVGKKCIIENKDVPQGDVSITYANIEEAKKYLNYEPKVNLMEGLQIFYNWMKIRY